MNRKYDILIDGVLVGKIGLTKAQAKWAVKLSKKYAVWIANQIKKFHLSPNRSGDKSSLAKVIEWKKKNEAVNLNDYDLASALKEAEKSDSSGFLMDNGSLMNRNVVASCPKSEFKWVEILSDDACREEGRAMKHCLKDVGRVTYICDGNMVFSLRDRYNKPVLTLQIDMENNISQYSAKRNEKPDAKYAKYFKHLEAYLNDELGLEINPESKFMLGIPAKLSSENVLEILSQIEDDCMDGGVEISEGRATLRRLRREAKKQGLKNIRISEDVLDSIEAQDAENDDSCDEDDYFILGKIHAH